MPERARLSIVVLTKNEERRIAGCLESVRWADELIVVDGLSTDRTVEICRRYGARVISRAFSGDFGVERNVGNDAATGDWILQLDGDDTVSEALRAQIEDILRRGAPYLAYNIRRKNWFLGHEMRYGGWYHYYPHFFRRGQAHFEGRVHHLLKAKGTLGTLEGAVEHRPFDSLDLFIRRHNRYTSIEAQEVLDTQGVLDPALVRYRIYVKPLKLIRKTLIKKAGWREGWYGFIFAILYAWVDVMRWAKYQELADRAARGETVPSSLLTGPETAVAQFVDEQNLATTEAAARMLAEGPRPARWTIFAQLTWRARRVHREALARRRRAHGRTPEADLEALLDLFAHMLRWVKCWERTRPVPPDGGPGRTPGDSSLPTEGMTCQATSAR